MEFFDTNANKHVMSFPDATPNLLTDLLVQMQDPVRRNSSDAAMVEYMSTVRDMGDLMTQLTHLDPSKRMTCED